MPDFNFAKGSSKRDAGRSAGAPRQHRAGPQQPGSGNSPQASQPEAGSASGKRGSVLDKYPERDLSHLTGVAPPPPVDEDVPLPDEYPQDDSGSAEEKGLHAKKAQTADTGAAGDGSASSSKWPLIALLGVVLFLIIIAFIWHVNPWPALKDSLTGIFSSSEQVEQSALPSSSQTEAQPADDEVQNMRSWDYYLQVSSWKDLAKADLDAERFRAQGFDVIVESEFIPGKGGTYYRVRLGPYASASEADNILKTHGSALPGSAFLDSTRLLEDEQLPAVAPAQSTAQKPRETARQPRADLVTEPMNGWAVKVSSFKDEAIAQGEARKLLEQGYPSFITRKRIASTTWYRVLVGPFSEKRDADRYMQLLNVTHGNEAYTVDLASY